MTKNIFKRMGQLFFEKILGINIAITTVGTKINPIARHG